MFDTLLVRPILNVLIAIYALIPGHNFGVAIILFTIVARLALWPLVRKQLHHAKAMRDLQPEIKKIKKNSNGDKQAEAAATMALYKEREINPFSGIGYLIIQLPILIALYRGVTDIAGNPSDLVDKAYGFIANLSWMEQLAADPGKFDSSFLGFVDLTDSALGPDGVNTVLLLIVVASAYVQYLASKQIMATQGEKKSLRELLRKQSAGEDVDQAEMMAAVSKTTIYFIPVIVLLVSLGLVGALPFYWLVNGIIAYLQQRRILSSEIMAITAEVDNQAVEAEVISAGSKRSRKAATAEVVNETGERKLNAKEKKLARQASKSAGNAKTKKEARKSNSRKV